MPIDAALVAGRLAELRERSGRSLSDVAESAGVAKSYVLKLERGEVENPGLATLGSLAKALDITLAELLSAPPGRATRQRPQTPTPNLPPSLVEFIEKQRATGENVEDALISALASLEFKGRRPSNSADWHFIFEAVKRSTGHK